MRGLLFPTGEPSGIGLLFPGGQTVGHSFFGKLGVEGGDFVFDGVDAVAPGLVLGVQLVWVVGQGFTCGLCLGILDGLVVVAVKPRLQRQLLAVKGIFLLVDV